MAYGVKYRIAYKRLSGSTTTIDILKNGYSSSVTNLTPAADPLEVDFDGNPQDIFEGTVGSGATIRVVVQPFQLIDIFTTDPQEYMVKIYDGTSGSTLIWQGFLNSGIYYEDLNSTVHSEIELKCNDGMAVLDMLPYRQDPSTLYAGHDYLGSIINKCLGKLALSWTTRWGLMNLSLYDYVDNPLLYLSAKQENFVDENSVPMSCRQVLTEMMRSFGLKMSFRGPTIYIIDPILLATPTLGQSFNSGWGESISTFPSSVLDISTNQIRWYKTGVSLDILSPCNQVDVKYDPYNFTSTIFNLSNSGSWSNAGSWGATQGNYPNQYKLNQTVAYTNVILDGSIIAEATKRVDDSDQQYYLKLLSSPNNWALFGKTGKAQFVFPNTCIYDDPSVYLKVSADYYLNTKSFSSIYDTSTLTETAFHYIDNSVGIKIGSDKDTSIYWQKMRVTSSAESGTALSTSVVGDQWLTGSKIFPLSHLSLSPSYKWDGSINVYIDAKYNDGWLSPASKCCLVKNVRIEPCDAAGNVLENNGINYNVLKNVSTYIIEPTTLDTLLGTGPYGISKAAYIENTSARGILSPGLYRIINDVVTGQQLYKCAHLLGQNFVSQYSQPRFLLKGPLKVTTQLMDIQNYLIKWSSRLPGKVFYISNGTYNDRREYFDAIMVECASTRENINLL